MLFSPFVSDMPDYCEISPENNEDAKWRLEQFFEEAPKKTTDGWIAWSCFGDWLKKTYGTSIKELIHDRSKFLLENAEWIRTKKETNHLLIRLKRGRNGPSGRPMPSQMSGNRESSTSPEKKKTPGFCVKWFSRGYCAAGSKCLHPHHPKLKGAIDHFIAPAEIEEMKKSKNQWGVCVHWLRGLCYRREKCFMAHYPGLEGKIDEIRGLMDEGSGSHGLPPVRQQSAPLINASRANGSLPGASASVPSITIGPKGLSELNKPQPTPSHRKWEEFLLKSGPAATGKAGDNGNGNIPSVDGPISPRDISPHEFSPPQLSPRLQQLSPRLQQLSPRLQPQDQQAIEQHQQLLRNDYQQQLQPPIGSHAPITSTMSSATGAALLPSPSSITGGHASSGMVPTASGASEWIGKLTVVATLAECQGVLTYLQDQPILALRVEAERRPSGEVWLVGIGTQHEEAFLFDVMSPDRAILLEALRSLLENPAIVKVLHGEKIHRAALEGALQLSLPSNNVVDTCTFHQNVSFTRENIGLHALLEEYACKTDLFYRQLTSRSSNPSPPPRSSSTPPETLSGLAEAGTSAMVSKSDDLPQRNSRMNVNDSGDNCRNQSSNEFTSSDNLLSNEKARNNENENNMNSSRRKTRSRSPSPIGTAPSVTAGKGNSNGLFNAESLKKLFRTRPLSHMAKVLAAENVMYLCTAYKEMQSRFQHAQVSGRNKRSRASPTFEDQQPWWLDVVQNVSFPSKNAATPRYLDCNSEAGVIKQSSTAEVLPGRSSDECLMMNLASTDAGVGGLEALVGANLAADISAACSSSSSSSDGCSPGKLSELLGACPSTPELEVPCDEQQTEATRILAQALPPALKKLLDAHLIQSGGQNLWHSLVEISLDLGRNPCIRFRGKQEEEQLSNLVVNSDCMQQALQAIVALYPAQAPAAILGPDNRGGLPGSLHRVSRIVNRNNETIGLTYRIGRYIPGCADPVQDLVARLATVDDCRGILLVGRPGVGKTTLLRDMINKLSDSSLKQRVLVVDAANEIAGEAEAPHSCIARARRLPARPGTAQHELLREAVENHSPSLVAVDELGSCVADVQALQAITRRGIKAVAAVHATSLRAMLDTFEWMPLLGNITTTTLADDEMHQRSQELHVAKQKTIRERTSPSPFSILVEVLSPRHFRVFHCLDRAVDCLLTGDPLIIEDRWVKRGSVFSKRSIEPTRSHQPSRYIPSWYNRLDQSLSHH